ncbi:MAG: hypothetical protein LBK23_10990 [Oscillospiraceae bacterium]|jgi:hypothetical protein|nr:hypothetical protein [Oscillospiraceae bacterium]
MTNKEKAEKNRALAKEAAELSKEIPDDDLRQVAGGDIEIPRRPGPDEFQLTANPFVRGIRLINAKGIIHILDRTGRPLLSVPATGGDQIIPIDHRGPGNISLLVQNSGKILKAVVKP